ncbi:MAG: hypothetical protein Q8R92_06280 [Deltaproteobacteria bacterium]|nr:hypothetical protein [Deltaproteobacteria bacterium]
MIDILREHGPLTDEQIQAKHDGLENLRPRRIGLWHKGRVEKTGEERLTQFRRKADVWRLVS